MGSQPYDGSLAFGQSPPPEPAPVPPRYDQAGHAHTDPYAGPDAQADGVWQSGPGAYPAAPGPQDQWVEQPYRQGPTVPPPRTPGHLGGGYPDQVFPEAQGYPAMLDQPTLQVYRPSAAALAARAAASGPAADGADAAWCVGTDVLDPQSDQADEPADRGYEVPQTPEAAWDIAPSRRRSRISTFVVLGMLVLQALLSLRLHNTAFEDEALYLYAGHAEIAHLFHGAALPIDYNAYFSGSPVLYPVLAAAVDSQFGLLGARLLSLCFMLATTALLFGTTRRLFNERAALIAAASFSVIEPVVVLGNYATYDAASLFLLALTTWIVIRTARRGLAAVLLAVPSAVLAVGVKYAAALYLPTITLLVVLAAWPHLKARSLLRGVVFAAMTGVGLLVGGKYSGLLAGVKDTTTNRAVGADPASLMLRNSLQWGGVLFGISVLGALLYLFRGRMNESPESLRMTGPGMRWRFALGAVLCGSALLAPIYQIHIHTDVSLFKHVGFGLFFAAPMAGVGISRIVGAHFRYPQIGILLWVVMLCMGIAQSEQRFANWPNSHNLVATIKPYVHPDGHYLGDAYEVPLYYLRDRTNQRNWTSTFNITYRAKDGKSYTGVQGYQQAIKAGDFDLVFLDGNTSVYDKSIAAALSASPRYRLLGEIPFKDSQGTGQYRIWIKQS